MIKFRVTFFLFMDMKFSQWSYPSTDDGQGWVQGDHPSSVTDSMGGPTPPSVIRIGWYGWAKPPSVDCDGRNRDRTTDTVDGWGVGHPSSPKTASVRPFTGIKMSATAAEGGQGDDDILGFPGDGFEDKTDATPGVLGEQDEEGDTHKWTWTLVVLCRSVSRSARKVLWFRLMGF